MFQIELLANGHSYLLRVPLPLCGVGVEATAVAVRDGVLVAGTAVGVRVGVAVAVRVAVGGTGVGVRVAVAVGAPGTAVFVGVGVTLGTDVAVRVAVADGGTEVFVAVAVAGTLVFVGEGCSVGCPTGASENGGAIGARRAPSPPIENGPLSSTTWSMPITFCMSVSKVPPSPNSALTSALKAWTSHYFSSATYAP